MNMTVYSLLASFEFWPRIWVVRNVTLGRRAKLPPSATMLPPAKPLRASNHASNSLGLLLPS